MVKESDYSFATGSELYDRISENAPELAERLVADIGPDYLLVADINDGLNTLSSNLGIDVPDGVVDIIPYAAAIVASARLIHSVIKTRERIQSGRPHHQKQDSGCADFGRHVPYGRYNRVGYGRRDGRWCFG